MGYASYSVSSRALRSEERGYATKSTYEIFKQRSINNAMNPYGVTLRESRDSQDHPNSIAVILALDETGSMGTVPHFLVKEGLPHMMEQILNTGIEDTQILFMGIGDHQCGDEAPLQIGQFETSDELLDKWLTDLYLEGGGGPNLGESYLLAWYFAAYHTSIDCFEKRNEKGFLFTIGDEPTLKKLSKHEVATIMGPGQYADFTAAQLLDKANEKYHCFHIHIRQTNAGSMQSTMDEWRQMMGDHLIVADRKEEVATIIANIITRYHKPAQSAGVPEQSNPETSILL